jgi:hypothetical protein
MPGVMTDQVFGPYRMNPSIQGTAPFTAAATTLGGPLATALNLVSRFATGKSALDNVLPWGQPDVWNSRDPNPVGNGENLPRSRTASAGGGGGGGGLAPTSPFTYTPPTGTPNPAWSRNYIPPTGDLTRYGIDLPEHTFFTDNGVPGKAA